jgi:hypothetical protein
MTDDRAVSIAVTHALTLAITTLLISGLLIGAGNVLSAQEKRVAQSQFDEIGGDLIAQLNSLDRLNETGDNVTVVVEPQYPNRVAGQTWNIRLIDNSSSEVYDDEPVASVLQIESPHHDRKIEYPLNNETAVEYGAPDNSHSPVLSLCSDGEIQFGECS